MSDELVQVAALKPPLKGSLVQRHEGRFDEFLLECLLGFLQEDVYIDWRVVLVLIPPTHVVFAENEKLGIQCFSIVRRSVSAPQVHVGKCLRRMKKQR